MRLHKTIASCIPNWTEFCERHSALFICKLLRCFYANSKLPRFQWQRPQINWPHVKETTEFSGDVYYDS